MTVVALLLAPILVADADAAKRRERTTTTAHQWAIGPRIGTFVIPGRFPASFPPKIANYNFVEEGELADDGDGNRDLDENGEERFTSLPRVRGDIQLGVDGFYAIDRHNRVGGGATFITSLDSDTRSADYWLTFNYDRVIYAQRQTNVVAGLQVGFGSLRLTGEDEDETYTMPYYPVRARVQGQFLNESQLYGLGAFVQTYFPSSTRYTDLDGVEQRVGSPLNFALFFAAGLEIQVQFGNVRRPEPKPKDRRGRKGKRGKRGKRGGGGGGDRR